MHFEDIKKNIKFAVLYVRYKNKANRLCVSDDLLKQIIDSNDKNEILNIMDKSKNINDFRENILKMLQNNLGSILYKWLLIGNITGHYCFFGLSYDTYLLKRINLSNFNYSNDDNKKILQVLRSHLFEYVMANNKIKNLFLKNESGKYDYTVDLTEEMVMEYFDKVVLGIENFAIYYSFINIEICNYIIKVIGTYTKNDILNHFDFIRYDLMSNKDKPLAERRKKYLEYKDLDVNQISKIRQIDKLKENLRLINNNDSLDLLRRLEQIENDVCNNIYLLEDIFLEYEILYREDLVKRLYIPTEKETIITDFRDLKPQLLHKFIRNPEKFKKDLEDKILNDIISSRTNSNKSKTLSIDEQKEYDKRLQGLLVQVDQTQVNYWFDSGKMIYTDKNGFFSYHSDTTNQISTSLFSESYFLNHCCDSFIGIGFNKESIVPESIVLSSDEYLTTNKGLNNLEYDETRSFDFMMTAYENLIKNDGKSEIILFRRNIDYDTKAAYVFVCINSDDKKSINLLEEARTLAEKNNLKLVIYDLKSINDSYQEYIKSFNDVQHKSTRSR